MLERLAQFAAAVGAVLCTKVWFMADTTHTDLADIVDITKAKKRLDRLQWDVVKLPHHCSYLSLGPEKGEDKTEPLKQIKELLEVHGQAECIVVSTSKPIPQKGTKEDEDTYNGRQRRNGNQR